MNNHRLIWGLICVACPVLAQSAVFKCTIDGVIVYQDKPCVAGQTPLALAPVPAPASIRDAGGASAPAAYPDRREPANRADAPAPVQEPAGPAPVRGNELVVGMSDTKILNMPRWGRPHKVSRTKANHAWLEEWTYFAPDGEKQLQFANGKLTGMRTPVAAVATSAPPILPSLPIEMPARATTPAPAETRIAAAVERAGPTSDAAHAVSDRQNDARDIDGASGSDQEDESR